MTDPTTAAPQPAAPGYLLAPTLLTILLLVLGLVVLREFLGALGWAAILAIATWPLYRRLQQNLPASMRRNGAALLFTLAVGLVVLVPLGLAAIEILRESRQLAHLLLEARRDGAPVPAWIGQIPWYGAQLAAWWSANLSDPAAAKALLGHADAAFLATWGERIGAMVARRTSLFAVTLLALFFLFRDGETLVAQLRVVGDRLLGPRAGHLSAIVVSAVRGTADGLVLVGLGEGAVLGIAYALLGVPHPAMLGAFTGLLAMVPMGAPLLFTAASLLLLATGATVAAIGLFAFGLLVVFVADHVLRPSLIGGAVRLPFLLVLLGIFGGLAAFGLLGLFLGPAILAVLVALWREWSDPGNDLPAAAIPGSSGETTTTAA